MFILYDASNDSYRQYERRTFSTLLAAPDIGSSRVSKSFPILSHTDSDTSCVDTNLVQSQLLFTTITIAVQYTLTYQQTSPKCKFQKSEVGRIPAERIDSTQPSPESIPE